MNIKNYFFNKRVVFANKCVDFGDKCVLRWCLNRFTHQPRNLLIASRAPGTNAVNPRRHTGRIQLKN